MTSVQLGTRTGNDKLMRVAIPSEDWDALQRLARRHNTTVSELVRRQVRNFVSSTAALLDTRAG